MGVVFGGSSTHIEGAVEEGCTGVLGEGGGAVGQLLPGEVQCSEFLGAGQCQLNRGKTVIRNSSSKDQHYINLDMYIHLLVI